MKIEKLTDNKLRIIINIDEFEKEDKNIDFNLFLKDKKRTSKLISSILKNAENNLNFYTDNSNLLIEMFSSENDFIIFILTKIVRNKECSKRQLSFGVLYKFNDFDDFLEFCINLNNMSNNNIIPKHILLYEYKNIYYIYISSYSYEKYRFFCNSILEFATLVDSNDFINNKVIEYGNIIFKNNTLINYIKQVH